MMRAHLHPTIKRKVPLDDAFARELLRKLVDNVPAMLAYWDSTLHCVFANRAYQYWFGVTPEQLVGTHISELLGPDLYRSNLVHIDAALRGHKRQFEGMLPDPWGGGPRHCIATIVPDNADSHVRGLFVLVTDVTQIKQAQLALAESEQRFRLAFDEAPIGMALVGGDGSFLRVNRALCDIVGCEPAELTGTTFQKITHPEDVEADVALLRRLEAGEIPRYTLEKRYIHKTGRIVPIVLGVSVVRDSRGKLVHYIAQIQDVSERKRAEQEAQFLAETGPVLADTLDLRETLSKIAALGVRGIGDFCSVDIIHPALPRQRTVACRDPAKQWLSDRVADIVLDLSRPHPLRTVFETRAPVLHESPTPEQIREVAQGEEHRELLEAAEIASFIAVPLVAHRQLFGTIGFVCSTPDRCYGEADVRLAERFAERAALSIENAVLYDAAKRAISARDDILGVVAHDLRNPLSTIVIQSTLMKRSRDCCEPEAVAAIANAAGRMDRLVGDLLDVHRMEAGRLLVVGDRVSAGSLIDAACASQKTLAEAAGVQLVCESGPDVGEVWADRDRVLQVLENLVGNALKFTPRGGRIALGARVVDGEVVFSVSDTGRGIAPEELRRVFERFWQRRKDEMRGTGLGLAIARGIVEAHGGRIWVDSKVGEGTTFFFTLASPRDRAPGHAHP